MTKERAEALRHYITLSVTGYSSNKNRIVQISLHTAAATLQHFPPKNYLRFCMLKTSHQSRSQTKSEGLVETQNMMSKDGKTLSRTKNYKDFYY